MILLQILGREGQAFLRRAAKNFSARVAEPLVQPVDRRTILAAWLLLAPPPLGLIKEPFVKN